MTDTTTRDLFIGSVKKYASDGLSNGRRRVLEYLFLVLSIAAAPIGDLYDTISGDAISFRARPVVGGHLALVSAFLSFFPLSTETSAVGLMKLTYL